MLKLSFTLCMLGLLASFSAAQISFDSPISIDYPSRQYAVEFADLNNDNFPDLISGGDPVGENPGKVYVSLNNGTGGFLPRQEYQVGTRGKSTAGRYVSKIAVADMDNDGHLDVVVGHNQAFQITRSLFITILWGNGTGNLQTSEAISFLIIEGDERFNHVAISDLNGDGLKDIFISCLTNTIGKTYLAMNLGARSFNPMGPRAVTHQRVEGLATGDFNRDSKPDIAVSSFEGIVLLYGNGAANFNFFGGAAVQRNIAAREIVVADFDNDGRIDIAAAADFQSKRVRVLIHRRGSWPRFPVNEYSYETRIFPDSLKTVDINGDGHRDLMFVDGRTGGVEILFGDSAGNFQLIDSVIQNSPAGDPKFADFDQDGKLDFVTPNPLPSLGGQVKIFRQSSTKPVSAKK